MFSLFRTLSWRYLGFRWERTLLVVASIALGVATLVSTQILNQVLEVLSHDTVTPIAVGDLHISNGEIGVDSQIVSDVQQRPIPGLRGILPLVVDRVYLAEMDNRAVILFGTDPAFAGQQMSDNPFQIRVELFPSALFASNRVLISRDLYDQRKQQGLADTAPLMIRVATSRLSFTPAGVIDFAADSPVARLARSLIVMDVAQAARTLRPAPSDAVQSITSSLTTVWYQLQPTRYTRIDLVIEKNANREQVQQAVQTIVGDRALVRTPETQNKSTDEIVGGIQTSFTLCSLGALIVGLFLVYNAMSVSVAERRHDIGVMRSLGATRWQIAQLFTVEALLMGFVGAMLGIPFAVVLANTTLNLVEDDLASIFLNGQVLHRGVDLPTGLLALGAGMLTTLLASLIPAFQAASDQPADAVRRASSETSGFWKWLHRSTCLFLLLGGIGLILFRHSLPYRIGSFGGFTLMMIGLFLSLPLQIEILTRLVQPLFRFFMGIEARLAADNLLRTPGRTGVVIGALAGGVSLMVQTAGVGRSNEEPVVAWLDQVIQADCFLFWGDLTTANSSATPMESHIAQAIRTQVPGVEEVVRLRFYRPEYNDTVIYVVAMDAEAYQRSIKQRLGKMLDGLDTFQDLPNGNYVVVSENFAIRHQKQIGDRIQIAGPKGPVDLEIRGIGIDYSWSRGTVFLDYRKYVELFQDNYVDIHHIFFAQDANYDQSLSALQEFADRSQLMIQERSVLYKFLAEVIDKIYKLAYIQQVVVGVVATLGVITALLISVLQRRRELGLLRAVGATRSQTLRTVWTEAILMGVLGTILGFFIGLMMEWYLLRVIIYEESGFFFPLIVPWKESFGIGLIAVAMATLAGLLPAFHAARLQIIEAIAYE